MKVRKTRKRRGFSLLELLAVVTILGIIAAVVIPRISVSAGAAKTNAHQSRGKQTTSPNPPLFLPPEAAVPPGTSPPNPKFNHRRP